MVKQLVYSLRVLIWSLIQGSVHSSCLIGAEVCFPGVWFTGDKIQSRAPTSVVNNPQQCVDYCRTLLGCVGGAYTPNTAEYCYSKYGLTGQPFGVDGGMLDSFSIANSGTDRSITGNCEATTQGCGNMQRIKAYVMDGQPIKTIHCGDSTNGDQIHFGDFNGDEICDVACWNQNSRALKWAKGIATIAFEQPANTGTDGAVGAFCTSTSQVKVMDINGDSKDDLICISPDNSQTTMISDEHGVNPSATDYDLSPLCQNLPNECYLPGSQSLCSGKYQQPLCSATGPVKNGIYMMVDPNEFVITCSAGFRYRGKSVQNGICNPSTGQIDFDDGLCIRTFVYEMPLISKKKVNMIAYATHETSSSSECAWICVDDIKCGALHFKESVGHCELFDKYVKRSMLQNDDEYSTILFQND